MDAAAGDKGGDIRFGDAAMAVGTRRDEQRGIVRIHIVEMDAQGEHMVEQRLGRGDMVDALHTVQGPKPGVSTGAATAMVRS